MKKSDESAELRKEIQRLRTVIARLGPDLDSLLKRRGFTIYTCEPPDDLLLPASRFAETFYARMKKYSFRLLLRDVIKDQEGFTPEQLVRYSSIDVVREYIDYLLAVGLVERRRHETFRLVERPVRSFGATLEWYLAEIFKREFCAEAVWGVKFKKIRSGGDYDLLAKTNGDILYMEVKSSPPKQVYDREITAFFNRLEDLRPGIAIFFMDTELRMKDKIVPMFEEELRQRHSVPPEVARMEKELFQVKDRIFIINATGSITANIQKALSWYFRNHA